MIVHTEFHPHTLLGMYIRQTTLTGLLFEQCSKAQIAQLRQQNQAPKIGVYLLRNQNHYYVGQSIDMLGRIQTHSHQGFIEFEHCYLLSLASDFNLTPYLDWLERTIAHQLKASGYPLMNKHIPMAIDAFSQQTIEAIEPIAHQFLTLLYQAGLHKLLPLASPPLPSSPLQPTDCVDGKTSKTKSRSLLIQCNQQTIAGANNRLVMANFIKQIDPQLLINHAQGLFSSSFFIATTPKDSLAPVIPYVYGNQTYFLHLHLSSLGMKKVVEKIRHLLKLTLTVQLQ